MPSTTTQLPDYKRLSDSAPRHLYAVGLCMLLVFSVGFTLSWYTAQRQQDLEQEQHNKSVAQLSHAFLADLDTNITTIYNSLYHMSDRWRWQVKHNKRAWINDAYNHLHGNSSLHSVRWVSSDKKQSWIVHQDHQSDQTDHLALINDLTANSNLNTNKQYYINIHKLTQSENIIFSFTFPLYHHINNKDDKFDGWLIVFIDANQLIHSITYQLQKGDFTPRLFLAIEDQHIFGMRQTPSITKARRIAGHAFIAGVENKPFELKNYYTVLKIGTFISLLIGLIISSLIYILMRQRWLGTIRHALTQSDQRFSDMFCNASIGLALLDPDGYFLHVNPSMCGLLGQAEGRILELNILDLVLEDDQRRLENAQRDLLDDRMNHWQGQLCLLDSHNRPHWISCHLTLIVNEDNQPQYFLVQLTDITKLKETELQLVEAKDAAEAGTEAKAAFLASMSHEIRTPMNGIISVAELMEQTPLNEEQSDLVRTMRSSGESLLSLINDVLDFSKIEAGKMHIERYPFALGDCVDAVIGMLSNQASKQRLALRTNIDDKTPLYVNGDEKRLRQILINLMSNAIKFTLQGSVSLDISCMQRDPESAWLRFTITDTGIGISEEQSNKIFKPFIQADLTTTRQFGGTGLGLSICQNLINLLDGRIGVTSKLGEGSSFWFEIPLAYNEYEQIQPEPLDFHAILLDSDENEANAFMQRLRHMGVQCTHCTTLSKVQEILEHFEPDIVMVNCHFDLDLQWPILKEIAQIKRHPPLIALSNNRMDEAIEPNIIDHLWYKPLPYHSFQIMLRRCCKNSSNNRLLTQQQEIKSPEPLSHLHILVAEDNAVNQKVIIRMLEKIGCKSTLTQNGQEAVQAFVQGENTHQFDLILMDCQMPIMDGFSATKEIRNHENPSSHIPIVALTANALTSDREHCLAQGMDDHVSKPVNMAELRETICKWTGINESK